MKTVLSAGPVKPPVTRATLKTRARIRHDNEDELIEELLAEALEETEGYLRRRLITQTWIQYWDAFADPLILPFPAQSVTPVQYLDGNSETQTVDTDVWELGVLNGQSVIRREYGESWPTPLAHKDAVWATFVAGYGDDPSDVPARIRAAIRLHAGFRFRHRESEAIPDAFFNYLRPLRMAAFAKLRANGQT